MRPKHMSNRSGSLQGVQIHWTGKRGSLLIHLPTLSRDRNLYL
jgi:hypothetical protein